MSAASVPSGLIRPAGQERLRLIETAMRTLADAPFELLRARGVVRHAADFAHLRAQGLRWLPGAEDAAAAAFFLLVEESHAVSEAAIAAARPAPT